MTESEKPKNWAELYTGKFDLCDRAARDVMIHAPRFGPPVYIQPDITETGVYAIQLPDDTKASITDPHALDKTDTLGGALPGIDYTLMYHTELHGTDALALWLNRSILDNPDQDPEAAGLELREKMKPLLKQLEKKFDLPLHSFVFTDESIQNKNNPTPYAIMLATDEAHQATLHGAVMSYLGEQHRIGRQEGALEPFR